ncbi:hypothetical protein TUM12370_28180 [Salmonella enterica subsp. enterica serovar Choleraesuis]|nr:hypothetical protein TUM12370_28180 [Salmonella enterica subsp. enterica serovar Choleraesuis]
MGLRDAFLLLLLVKIRWGVPVTGQLNYDNVLQNRHEYLINYCKNQTQAQKKWDDGDIYTFMKINPSKLKGYSKRPETPSGRKDQALWRLSGSNIASTPISGRNAQIL